MSSVEIKQNILKALDRMSLIQQVKLLEFINSFLALPEKKESNTVLQFAGIFDEQDAKDFHEAMKDCNKIDEDEW